MQINSLPSERVAIVALTAPASLGTGAVSTGYFDASLFKRYCAILQTGVMGSSATLDGKWQQADDTSGTNLIDVPGGAITQVLAASNNGKQVVANLNTDSLTKRYVKYVSTWGTAASLGAVLILGFDGINDPASLANAATVIQTDSV